MQSINVDPQWIADNITTVVITGVVGALLGVVIKRIKNLTLEVQGFVHQNNQQSVAIRNLIKMAIITIHDVAKRDGYISKYKLECTERLYQSYKDLHGNSYVEDLMKEIREMEVK